MKKYTSPQINIALFTDDTSVFAASTAVTESTKEKVTGDGPGIVLPDDEW